ncbi:unnamed protein product [Gemmataceae bacterium]|nr:unnamed protein product [Gemmataceae bacterium]VTU01884.1 unnamed protein product [Gemmataceae bacterium]
MPILTQPSFGPRTALMYVTGGALIDVWTLVWYFTRDHEMSRSEQFWVIGLCLTGLTFVILGLLLGPLGRSARQAELPPAEALRAEAAIQQTAAANPPAVAAGVGAHGAAVPGAPVMAAAPQGAVIPPPPAGAVLTQPRVG